MRDREVVEERHYKLVPANEIDVRAVRHYRAQEEIAASAASVLAT
jgi:hypothetical protein